MAKECRWCKFTDAEKQNIIYESVHWYVFLADKQDYLGRCILVLKRHCPNLSHLDLTEWIELKEIITKIEDCLKNVLGADLCNWSCLMNDFYKSDTPNPHLHLHVRPRYNKDITINNNSYFDMEFGHHYNPKKETLLSDNDRKILFEKIKIILIWRRNDYTYQIFIVIFKSRKEADEYINKVKQYANNKV